MNVYALQELIQSQTLAYKFPFSQFSFRTDNSCIVLSEGRKSAFLKVNTKLLSYYGLRKLKRIVPCLDSPDCSL